MLFFNTILLPFDHERLFLYQTVSGKKNCVRIPNITIENAIDDCGLLNAENSQSVFDLLSKNLYFHPYQQQYNIPINGFGESSLLSHKTHWILYIDLGNCTDQNLTIIEYLSTCLDILQTHFSTLTLDLYFCVSHPKHLDYLNFFYEGAEQWISSINELYCCLNSETVRSVSDELHQKLLSLNFKMILELDAKEHPDVHDYAAQPFHFHSIRYAFQAGYEHDVINIVNTHLELFESTRIGLYPISSRFGHDPHHVDIHQIHNFDVEEFCNQFELSIQSCSNIQRFEYAIEIKARMNGVGSIPGFGVPTYAKTSSKTLVALTDRMNNPIDLLSTLDHYNHPTTNSNCVSCPIQHLCGGFRPFDFAVEHDHEEMAGLFSIYCTMQKRLIQRIIRKLFDPMQTQSN